MLLNERTPVISEDSASRETFERVVTHNDFDGIVSASICCWALKIEKVFFAGPLTITHSKDHDHGAGCGV